MILRDELLALVLDERECADPLAQQRVVLARQSAPRAQRVEAVLEPVLVDHGRERADLLDLLGHADACLGAQPSPVIESVLGDDPHTRGDVVTQPLIDLLGIEVL
jgi:hypothetical protein